MLLKAVNRGLKSIKINIHSKKSLIQLTKEILEKL